VRWVVAFRRRRADTVARNSGARVAEIIGQQVTIDNRTGRKLVNRREPCFIGLQPRPGVHCLSGGSRLFVTCDRD
jgi:hypothetical protein